jgi:hypothetical protein
MKNKLAILGLVGILGLTGCCGNSNSNNSDEPIYEITKYDMNGKELWKEEVKEDCSCSGNVYCSPGYYYGAAGGIAYCDKGKVRILQGGNYEVRQK